MTQPGFLDARYVREGVANRQGVGRPAPWNKSLGGYRLPLVLDEEVSPGFFDFVLPFGTADDFPELAPWLAPTRFEPREIEIVTHADMTDDPGVAFMLDREATVLCKGGASGPSYVAPSRATRTGPGGTYRAELRARLQCPTVIGLCPLVLRVGWTTVPGIDIAHRGASIIAYRDAGFGWEIPPAF